MFSMCFSSFLVFLFEQITFFMGRDINYFCTSSTKSGINWRILIDNRCILTTFTVADLHKNEGIDRKKYKII